MNRNNVGYDGLNIRVKVRTSDGGNRTYTQYRIRMGKILGSGHFEDWGGMLQPVLR
jgi:hypothetical protein